MGRPSKYPEEFRREAVALYRSSDRSRAEVAKSLGISDGSLAAWAKSIESEQEPGALDADERAELQRLRRHSQRIDCWQSQFGARPHPLRSATGSAG
jgi:Transposase.